MQAFGRPPSLEPKRCSTAFDFSSYRLFLSLLRCFMSMAIPELFQEGRRLIACRWDCDVRRKSEDDVIRTEKYHTVVIRPVKR